MPVTRAGGRAQLRGPSAVRALAAQGNPLYAKEPPARAPRMGPRWRVPWPAAPPSAARTTAADRRARHRRRQRRFIGPAPPRRSGPRPGGPELEGRVSTAGRCSSSGGASASAASGPDCFSQGRDHQHRRLAQPDSQERGTPGRTDRPSAGLQAQARMGRRLRGCRAAPHAREQPVPRGEHVARPVVVKQPRGPLPQRRDKGPVGQGRPGERRGLPGEQRRGPPAPPGPAPRRAAPADAGGTGDEQHLRLARGRADAYASDRTARSADRPTIGNEPAT